MGNKKDKKQKVILPPELPPDVPEDEIEVSDEDVEFVNENSEYAGLVSRLDTKSITKHVTRIADVKEDDLEALYEKRLKRKAEQQLKEKKEVEVDPVDALPVKTLDGKLYYRTLPKTPEISETEDGGVEEDSVADKSIIKPTKAERRVKLKKSKKESKRQEKEPSITEEVKETPQAAVLEEVKDDLTAEAGSESQKQKLAELGLALLSDPESNLGSLKEMLQICKSDDHSVVKLGLLSLLAVFKDIVPGYRIRLPTEKELEMKISKDIKKMRLHESTLLKAYKAYLQKLLALENQSIYHHVVVRCLCTLLAAVPHFNYRENLLNAVVRQIGSPDDIIRRLCCTTIKSLFTNEGKHGGEATLEAVRLIADHVKTYNCQLHPDSVEVLLSLSFDEDIRKPENPDGNEKARKKRGYKRKTVEEPNQVQDNRKKSKREQMTKMNEEVAAELKAASFTPDYYEKRRMQSETLSAVFETYFRILKQTMLSNAASSEEDDDMIAGAFGPHPLLDACLNGLGKYSHLIDLDYMGDLMNYLRKLAAGSRSSNTSSQKCFKHLTVSERLRCCIVAFKVMRINLDALNVDLQDFFAQLYNLLLEYRPGRDQGLVFAEALKIMLCQDRHHDMTKTAAFVKRLATYALCFGCAESMAALVTIKHLLQKNVKCRNLLENDSGGGSVSGSIAKYHPYATDPNLSGALASVLWEINLLFKHYHPILSTMASTISTMDASHSQVYHAVVSPQQAFMNLSLEHESFKLKNDKLKSKNKKKGGNPSATTDLSSVDENLLSKKLAAHFDLLHDIKENEKMRSELDRTNKSLQLYEEYKKQKKKPKSKIKRKGKC